MSAKPLAVRSTPIPGMVIVDLPVHGDNRGWFKENWQQAKMSALGLPDFGPVQNNVSFNQHVGVTRGFHAEPWDKYVSVATGRIFGAWVDLREGPSFGKSFSAELDPSSAVFVPRGVGNAFQTLEEGTAYIYLVSDHWSEQAQNQYTFLNLADPSVGIEWPIALDSATLSDKDLQHPFLSNVSPVKPKRTLVLGANGQLGRSLTRTFPNADFMDRSDFDLSEVRSFDNVRWEDYDVVINAAAYTRVDEAETQSGRSRCWATNVEGLSRLAGRAIDHRFTLVHVSSDYVFDGSREIYCEGDDMSPLGVYGQTKAGGEAIVSSLPKHYIIRTSWVIGDGSNFVRTMASLAARSISPAVVDDQFGRLTFSDDLAVGIGHLLRTSAAYGTYNMSNAGPATSWFDIARRVFATTGYDPALVRGVSTTEYFAGKQAAPRPRNSLLSLDKLIATGFRPRDAFAALDEYLTSGFREVGHGF